MVKVDKKTIFHTIHFRATSRLLKTISVMLKSIHVQLYPLNLLVTQKIDIPSYSLICKCHQCTPCNVNLQMFLMITIVWPIWNYGLLYFVGEWGRGG